jgi:4-amino-4-deoxy-L-arabinose transferase-like glycosyltransferase
MNASVRRTYRQPSYGSHFLSAPAQALWLLIAVLLSRGPAFTRSVINADESVFALAAREVLNGHLPYTTLFDNKPVGSTLIMAGALRLLGESILSVRLIGALAVWLAALLISHTVARSGRASHGLLAGFILVAYESTTGGLATMTEILLIPFTVLCMLLLRNLLNDGNRPALVSRAALAGLACGVAIAIKLVPAIPCFLVAAVVLFVLWQRGRARLPQAMLTGMMFAAASCLPMVVAASVYARAGELPAFTYSNFGFARDYTAIHPSLMTMVRRLGRVAVSIWPLIVAAVLSMPRLVTNWREHRRDDLLPIAWVWLIGEVLAASMSLQFWPHNFLTALPPLAILSVYGLRTIAERVPPKARWVLFALAVVVPLASAALNVRNAVRNEDVARQIAQAIQIRQSGRIPRIYVTSYQMSVLYLLTRSPLPPTRYAVPAHLTSRLSAMVQADPARELGRVLASRPDYIILDEHERMLRTSKKMLARTITSGYRQVFADGDIRVYQTN